MGIFRRVSSLLRLGSKQRSTPIRSSFSGVQMEHVAHTPIPRTNKRGKMHVCAIHCF